MFKDSEKQKEIPHSSDNNNKSQENLHLSKELATKGNSPLVTKNKKLIKEYIDTKHGDEHPAIKGALTTIIETKLDNPLTIEVLRENFKEKYKQSIDYQALIEDIQSKL